MCNLYESTPRDKINMRHALTLPDVPYERTIAPLRAAPFVMAQGTSAVGQWGMIPYSSKTRIPTTSQGKRMSTNNARSETVATAWTFRQAWTRGRRCLIPADSYDEPYWGTGKNIWWRFRRADGQPWALAGIWDEWIDKATGEVVPNFTMLTMNCDAHPLLRLMHKPDPKLAPDAQDKRSVVPIEVGDWDRWLHGSIDDARDLIRVPAQGLFDHGPADPQIVATLPL